MPQKANTPPTQIIWRGTGSKHTDYIYKEKDSLRVVTDAGGDKQKEAVFSLDNTEAAWEFINKAMRRRLTKKKPAHGYGKYKWVKLTDEQYARLIADYGETLIEKAVQYIDEQAQLTANKNKWRDWNLVLCRCIREQWVSVAEPAENKPNYDMDEFQKRADRLPLYIKK